jgi:hypothetical protein
MIWVPPGREHVAATHKITLPFVLIMYPTELVSVDGAPLDRAWRLNSANADCSTWLKN